MEDIQKIRELAKLINNGDDDAWEPLYDLLLETGGELWAECHYFDSYCRNGKNKCELIQQLMNYTDEHIINKIEHFKKERIRKISKKLGN